MTFSLSEWIEPVRAHLHRQDGQTMAEYGVILAVIVVGIVLAVGLLSNGIQNAITTVVSNL